MSFKLSELPYKKNSLEPNISAETFEFHYGKHHQGYVTKLNALVQGTELEKKSLAEIILQTTDQVIYNNAAQVFNHTFYWNCMVPEKQTPQEKTLQHIKKKFGSYDAFKEQFITATTTLFGSGWVWLVQNQDETIEIKKTNNAGCPLSSGQKPLLTCDVWEHAYYIDYKNGRKNYVEAWWNLINWEFVEKNI
ncbi:superoxide dismutase [bacterium]|nr:superoxide dismutase [bacterium]